MPLDPDSPQYADRYYHGKKTSTVVLGGNDQRPRAVCHAVFNISLDELLPRVRSRTAARRYAIEFAAANFLRKWGKEDPAWSAMDEFVLAIPENERYW